MDINKIVNIEAKISEDNIVLQDRLESEPFYVDDFYSHKEYKTFLNRVTRLVRSSRLYRGYVASLSEMQNMNSCSIMGEVSEGDAEIEMHHYPFTIFDLANIVVRKRLGEGEKVNSILCAKELMELHIEHYVGLVPLSVTAHQIAHTGKIFIPLTMVFGNIQGFIEKYKDYIPEMQLEIYNSLVEKTENNDEIDPNNLIKGGLKEFAVEDNIITPPDL